MIITADITSFVDDYSLNTIGKSQKRLSVNQNGKQKIFQWFTENQMKANPDKFH